jgi:MFS family permease
VDHRRLDGAMFVGVGVGYYGLAVFIRELETGLGWSSTLVGSATGIYFTVSGLTSWAVGPYIDRSGPRGVMLAGVLMLGIGIMFIGTVSEPWHLFAVYGVMAVGYGCSASVGINSIMSRWFVTRRARAMSVTFAGVSLGGVVLAPFSTWIITTHGFGPAGVALGCLLLVVGVPVALWVLVWDPGEIGLAPDFGSPLDVRNADLDAAVQQRVWTRREAMGTVTFWLFCVQAGAVVAISLVENSVATWLLVLVIGFTIGNVYMLQTLLVSEIFGMVSLGAVLGATSLATQTASGFGPFAVGWLRDATDGFIVPFLVTASASFVAAGVVLLARPPQPGR